MGVFAKVMIAVAILVANGALLFFILRFLLWLAFPAMKGEREARPTRTAPVAAVNILAAAAAAAAPELGAASAAPGAPAHHSSSRRSPDRVRVRTPTGS